MFLSIMLKKNPGVDRGRLPGDHWQLNQLTLGSVRGPVSKRQAVEFSRKRAKAGFSHVDILACPCLAHTHTYIHAHMHMRPYARAHTHTHGHTHGHRHMHTRTPPR